MVLKQNSTGIALNVTRTRVTILVFNLTIISLMLSMLAQNHGLVDGWVATTKSHLTTFVALFIGFCLTIFGLFWLLRSQNWDAEGLSNPRPFTFGAITTYLALSQTITAFIHEYLHLFDSIEAGAIHDALSNAQTDTYAPMFYILMVISGGIWFLITYFAPLMAGIKGSAHVGQRWVFVVYYFALQIPVYWVCAKAWQLQLDSTDHSMNLLKLFALQFIQPLLWLE